MNIEESLLFHELDPGFMNEIAKMAIEESYSSDQVIFNRGDSAENLYIMVDGHVTLFIEEGGSINFTVDDPGEVFGWSALVEPNVYTASARCYEDSTILRIEATSLEHVFERFPKEAYLVMKRLSGVIGQRLVNSYEDHLRSRTESATPSYG